jgi:divalent metal cation (Fe/Co/Zn/Cd) transporter
MFGSQALETAIGLAVMFFILATAASAITESTSRLMKKRSSDLETTIKEMLTAPAPDNHESRKDRRTRLDSS